MKHCEECGYIKYPRHECPVKQERCLMCMAWHKPDEHLVVTGQVPVSTDMVPDSYWEAVGYEDR